MIDQTTILLWLSGLCLGCFLFKYVLGNWNWLCVALCFGVLASESRAQSIGIGPSFQIGCLAIGQWANPPPGYSFQDELYYEPGNGGRSHVAIGALTHCVVLGTFYPMIRFESDDGDYWIGKASLYLNGNMLAARRSLLCKVVVSNQAIGISDAQVFRVFVSITDGDSWVELFKNHATGSATWSLQSDGKSNAVTGHGDFTSSTLAHGVVLYNLQHYQAGGGADEEENPTTQPAYFSGGDLGTSDPGYFGGFTSKMFGGSGAYAGVAGEDWELSGGMDFFHTLFSSSSVSTDPAADAGLLFGELGLVTWTPSGGGAVSGAAGVFNGLVAGENSIVLRMTQWLGDFIDDHETVVSFIRIFLTLLVLYITIVRLFCMSLWALGIESGPVQSALLSPVGAVVSGHGGGGELGDDDDDEEDD